LIEFENLDIAHNHIKAAGFVCTSDRADGTLQNGFLVSQEAVDWKIANELHKGGKLGPEWKGKVWVTYNGPSGDLVSLPSDGGKRVWGAVCVFGDAEFLDELESVLQRRGIGQM